jgi:hypothetical protein
MKNYDIYFDKYNKKIYYTKAHCDFNGDFNKSFDFFNNSLTISVK